MIDSISSISNLSINVPKLKSTSFNGGEPIQDKPLGRYGFEWDLKVPPTNLCSITLPEKVMAQLQSELGPQCDKSVAINLEHSHFGQVLTGCAFYKAQIILNRCIPW